MSIRHDTIQLLRSFNAPERMKGYTYFLDAIEMIDRDTSFLLTLQEMYELIADNRNVTAESVRKAIERFVERVWIKTSLKRRPTNQEFMSYIYITMLRQKIQ